MAVAARLASESVPNQLLDCLRGRASRRARARHKTRAGRVRMPVTIWGARETRSDLVEWACKELAVEYTFVEIDWANNEHKSEKYLQVVTDGCLGTCHLTRCALLGTLLRFHASETVFSTG